MFIADEETLSKFKRLKILSRVGIGYDSVDLNYLRKNNIKLTITLIYMDIQFLN